MNVSTKHQNLFWKDREKIKWGSHWDNYSVSANSMGSTCQHVPKIWASVPCCRQWTTTPIRTKCVKCHPLPQVLEMSNKDTDWKTGKMDVKLIYVTTLTKLLDNTSVKICQSSLGLFFAYFPLVTLYFCIHIFSSVWACLCLKRAQPKLYPLWNDRLDSRTNSIWLGVWSVEPGAAFDDPRGSLPAGDVL